MSNKIEELKALHTELNFIFNSNGTPSNMKAWKDKALKYLNGSAKIKLSRIEIITAEQNSYDFSFDKSLIDPRSQMIVQGLGGRSNFTDLDCCITRLRATIKDDT